MRVNAKYVTPIDVKSKNYANENEAAIKHKHSSVCVCVFANRNLW